MHNTTLLMAAAVTLGLLAGCATKPPSNISDACAIFAEQRGWERSTRRAEQRWGVPAHIQLAIVHQESSFLAKARPPRRRLFGLMPTVRPSSAYGYAQAKDATWDWYRKSSGNTRAHRARFADAVDFIGWYGDVTHRTLGIPKADARRQYLAYHEGHGGFKRASYRNKSWLVEVAARVARNAERYRQQLSSCRNSRGSMLLPF